MYASAPVTQMAGGASMFDMMDANHDGTITRAEFAQAFR
jgi:Ca2+-binding EF-hand superfamily protein